jgi:hypothetical protein
MIDTYDFVSLYIIKNQNIMKIKLLLLFCLSTVLIQAQAPVTNYFSAPLSEYAIVSGTTDQTATGANATWNFSGLTSTENNIDTYTAPTAGQLADYPGTTQVFTITDEAMNATDAFFKVVGSDLSLTGASNPQFVLDYNTDNAFIGTYPLTFGTAATVDNIAGQIMAQGQTANYTGTITTEVDAHGTLTFDVVGQGTYSGSVTRIKTVQQIGFTIVIFPGTASITTYNYYKDSDGALVFRTTDGGVDVPGVLTDTFSSAEALITNTLSIDDNQLLANEITIYPNPAQNVLNIQLANSNAIEFVRILDINGRTVLTTNDNSNVIDVNSLQAGFYIVTVSTQAGTVTKKFIKE